MRAKHVMGGTLLALGACLALAGCRFALTSHTQAPSATAQNSATASPEAAASAVATASGESTTPVSAESSTGASTQADATRTPATPHGSVAPLLPPIATLPAPLLARTLTGPSNLGVPVLMYHVIGIAPAAATHPDLYVTPADFVSQLRYLSTHGYHAVTLQRVWDYWHGSATLPSKPVVLSFDDGDTPDFTIVAPLLNELRWPGTLNLIVGRKRLRFKSSVVRALIAAGWEIDSHTMTHTDVPGLPAKRLRYEVAQSRARLQKLYGVPVNFFCYPSGRFDANGVAAVQAAGYLGATTTLGGLARPDDPWRMRRVRVLGGMGVKSFSALLREAR